MMILPQTLRRSPQGIVSHLLPGSCLLCAAWLGKQLAACLSAADYDLIVPLPLRPSRLQTRYFNQSLEISRAIGKSLGIAIDSKTLIRSRATPAQAELPLKERAKNVRGAFECAGDLSGKRILLVDDVMTTASTVREAARILKLHGASEITVAVAAHALRHQ